MKILIMMTLLFWLFGCNKNINTNHDSDTKDEINVESESEIRKDSINTLIEKAQIEADSICSCRGHIFEECESKLRALHRDRINNSYGSYMACGIEYVTHGSYIPYEKLPSEIIDYDDRTVIVTTNVEYKYCYRCMRNIEFKTETTKVIWDENKKSNN